MVSLLLQKMLLSPAMWIIIIFSCWRPFLVICNKFNTMKIILSNAFGALKCHISTKLNRDYKIIIHSRYPKWQWQCDTNAHAYVRWVKDNLWLPKISLTADLNTGSVMSCPPQHQCQQCQCGTHQPGLHHPPPPHTCLHNILHQRQQIAPHSGFPNVSILTQYTSIHVWFLMFIITKLYCLTGFLLWPFITHILWLLISKFF